MEKTRGKLRIMNCESGKPFAEKVMKELETKTDVKQVETKEIHFANTEIKSVIGESIRGADIYIIQDCENSETNYSIDENVGALKTAIDAARRSDVNYITAVLPVFPYARQDKANGREGITAARVAREIEDAGANMIITLDVHNSAIEGYFRKAAFEDLHASKNIIDYIKNNNELFNPENTAVMPADLGGAKRAEHYAQKLGMELFFVYKKRNDSKANIVDDAVILGDVTGKNILMVDDMIDTGGSILKVAKLTKEKGAKKIYCVCSLPLFNRDALENIDRAYREGYLEAIITTDAVHHGLDFTQKHPWHREVLIAKYFAAVINRLNKYQSISYLLDDKKR